MVPLELRPAPTTHLFHRRLREHFASRSSPSTTLSLPTPHGPLRLPAEAASPSVVYLYVGKGSTTLTCGDAASKVRDVEHACWAEIGPDALLLSPSSGRPQSQGDVGCHFGREGYDIGRFRDFDSLSE